MTLQLFERESSLDAAVVALLRPARAALPLELCGLSGRHSPNSIPIAPIQA